MNTYTKTLLTIVPVVAIFFIGTIGITYYFSRSALTDMAEAWLTTRASEAMDVAIEQEDMLREYGLMAVPASIKKAKLDASALMQTIEVGRFGYIYAVTAKGIVAVHPDASRVGVDVSDEPWFRKLAHGSGRLFYSDRLVPSLAIYEYFEPWDWFILATDPEKEVYGAADKMRFLLGSLAIFVVMIMSLGLMFVTRRLTNPLRALTIGAERIGRGELDTRIAIRSTDEVGQLAEVFNRMAAELQQTLTALKHKEEHSRAIIENSSDLIAILDAKANLSYLSPSTRRILGFSPEDLMGRSAFDLVHPEDLHRIMERFELRSQSLVPTVPTEFRFKHWDGSWRTIEGVSENLLDHPAVNGLVINARDVSARKEIEEALNRSHQDLERRVAERTRDLIDSNQRLAQESTQRKNAVAALAESEQRMRAILRASPVGIAVIIDTAVDWANETLYQMLGHPKEALLGCLVETFYEDLQAYTRADTVLANRVKNIEIGEVETRWVRMDGSAFDCRVRAYPLLADDPSKGHILVVSDTSEAKRLEEMLQRARKMEAIGTLAGGVAHDLNNILSGIVSYPELMLYKLPEDSDMRGPMKTIHKSGLRAAAIVQDLLTMARRGVAVTEVVNLNDIIAEQLNTPEFLKLKSDHSDIQIRTEFDKALLPVKGSPAHLSKSIMNLLSNAAEAMPDGGTIRLATKNIYIDKPIHGYEQVIEGDYVAITVADTGIGIANSDVERIFEPFYTHKKMGRSGTGLGMAVVWGTIKDHNGYIDVNSIEGEGTSFQLYLPVTRERNGAVGEHVRVAQLQGSGETILVVDDAEAQREIATEILEALGYRVIAIPSGEEAVEFLQQRPVDLIVLDMIMPPGMDGLDTYRKILRHNPNQKAIIASGFAETSRVKEAKRIGVQQYLRKPYTIEKIGMAVRDAIAASHPAA